VATVVELHPSIGSVWARGLFLWSLYATGVYIDWDHTFDGSGPCKAWDITVTNPDESEDTFTLVSLDLGVTDSTPVTWLASSPGFNATLNAAYPDILPDGSLATSAFSAMVWGWRQTIWSNVTGVTSDISSSDDSGARYGLISTFFKTNYVKNLVAVVDGTGIVHGTLGSQVYVGDPSDFIGQRPGAAAPGGAGGGSVDLSPVVEAINEISDQETNFQCNQTGDIWSIKSRVRTP